MRILSVVTTVMLALFIAAPNTFAQRRRTGTAQGTPLEGTVNAALKYKVTVESNGALVVASFRKTNGYDRGNGLYVIEWQGDVLFEQEGYKPGNAIIGYWQDFRVLREPPSRLDAIVMGNTIHFDKGARVRLTGDSVLRKTEQGWRIEGLSVKTGEVVAARPSTNGSTQGISPPYVAFDGKFSYRPPDGWVLQDNPGSKYKVAVLSNREGFGPNVNVGADFYPGTLDAYLAYVLHTLEAGMTFRVLSQSDFTTAVNQRAIRAIGRLEAGGKSFRLSIYVFSGENNQKFMVTCSVPALRGEAYDAIFATSMKTFKTPA